LKRITGRFGSVMVQNPSSMDRIPIMDIYSVFRVQRPRLA